MVASRSRRPRTLGLVLSGGGARGAFQVGVYDRLLADYAEHPRTIVLSTHLIDEVSNLLEHVLVIDDGRILIDSDAEALRGSATTVAGTASTVEAASADA